MKKSFLLFLFITAIGWATQAQRPPVEFDPERIAQMQTDMLDKELSLTKKQRKKVYKLYLKQAKEMQSMMRANHPGVRPPMMGGGRGPGGMGGGRGPGGGRPGGGRPSMNHGQQPSFDHNTLENAGTTPNERQMIPEESDEQIEALEKKMENILKPDQFTHWQEVEQERRQKEKKRRRIEEQERLFPKFEQPEKPDE